MLRNYLVTAYRHLIRHPLYSAINILGFAVGLACCIIIIAYVRGELSYDGWVKDNDRVYRVVATFHGEPQARLPVIMGPAGRAMAAELPGIESFVRFRRNSDAVKRGDALFYEQVMYSDPSFFDVIPLPLAAGDAASALREPNTVIVSEAMAKKYFGAEDPMGEVMVFDGKPMTVTGVLKDLPENTHLRIDFLSNYRSASYDSFAADPGGDAMTDLEQDWGSANHFTYIKLAPGARIDDVTAGLPAFEERHMTPAELSSGVISGGDFVELKVQPFADVHLHSADLSSGGEMVPPGDIVLVYAFSGIAALILLIASINFVVLTTARSSERAKEIGMRKVLGSTRRALIVQFLMETMIVALVAFVIALALSELLTPFVRDVLQSPLVAGDPGFIAAELMVIAAVGLAAGAYPALYMSAMRPAEALKGRLKMARGRLRNALVVVQFSISIALIIVASVMFAQTSHMRNVRPGYNAEDVVVIRGFWREQAKSALEPIRARLETEPSIKAIAAQHAAPGDLNFENRTYQRPGGQRISFATTAVDFGFFELYEVKLLAGRTFARDRAADITTSPPESGSTSANAVLTRSATKVLGFETPEAAIGQAFDRLFEDNDGKDTGQRIHYTIVGVVDDIQLHDARFPQEPTIFFVKPDELWSLSIKAEPGQAAAAAAAAEAAWKTLLPELPPRVVHLDTQFANTFARDQQKGVVFAAFAGLGLSIACLGLFGLAAFTVERRTKEIGIRKVMGATTGRIVALLVWQFSRPVLIANLLAWPLAWWASREWLAGFADRIDLTPVYFLAASLIVLLVSWVTVSGHAWRVARAKPVSALRYE